MDHETVADPLTLPDRALLLAARGWESSAPGDLWMVLADDWRGRLAASGSPLDPESARAALGREHAAQARPDLDRVHPSWWVRALKDESPAVRRTVAAQASGAVGVVLRAELGLSEDDRAPEHAPHPEAVRVALALWAERLVGDLPDRDDDPPVIVALTRYPAGVLSRLLLMLALTKRALAGDLPADPRLRDRDRLEHFRTAFDRTDPRRVDLARRDLARHGEGKATIGGALGLVTIARLLERADPYRVRWALQHLPYPVAKFTRGLMDPNPGRDRTRFGWESEHLRAATDRLRAEGRLADDGEAAP